MCAPVCMSASHCHAILCLALCPRLVVVVVVVVVVGGGARHAQLSAVATHDGAVNHS